MSAQPRPGDLVKFDYVYNGCVLNHKLALFLGEYFIHRPDGVTIENYKVLLHGELKHTIIDRGLFPRMKVVR